jgi:hypothetical protein
MGGGRRPWARGSGRGGERDVAAAGCSPELQEVVGRADQQPLASVLEEPPKRHLPNAAASPDLTKDGFDGGFASESRASSFSIRSQLIALCLLALAFILVPSIATCPSSQARLTCTPGGSDGTGFQGLAGASRGIR